MESFVVRNGQTYHVHRLRVRYADTDRMDMVYHGTYAAYLEAARVEMLRDAGWVYAELEKDGILLPVVQLNLTYKKPARYDQLLEFTPWLPKHPRPSCGCSVISVSNRMYSCKGKSSWFLSMPKVADLVVPLLGLQNALLNWG